MHKMTVSIVMVGVMLVSIIGMSVMACVLSSQSAHHSSTESFKRGQASSILMKLKSNMMTTGMARGFTLLELMIVIIIIGVLATTGVMQYQAAIERSRGAEGRAVLGTLRSECAAMYMGVMNTSSCTNASLRIGSGVGFVPSGCNQSTNYFSYALTSGSGSAMVLTATRCTGTTGKQPGSSASATLTLTTDFSGGTDAWSGSY
jgi:prepilin-type N-terminal cleavage/methylation domain-containing protein